MDSVRVLLAGASSGAQGAARSGRGRKPRAQRATSRFVHIFTLMFFLSSLLSPIAAQSAFAQDEPAEAMVEEAAPAEVVAEEAAPIVAAAGALQISLYGNNGAALSGLFVVTDAAGAYHEVWVNGGVGTGYDLGAGQASVTQSSGTTDYGFDGSAVSYVNIPSGDVAVHQAANTFQDADGDGVGDSADICAAGNDAADTDVDGTPDACDATPNGDTDGDGIDNAADTTPNGDTDGDGIDNLSDATPNGDTDGDGVDNAADLCPAGDDAADADGDGTADACDATPNGDVPAEPEAATVSVEVAEEPVVVEDAEAVSCVEAEGASPWILSDLADYPPGALVTLTGGNWVPGQSVEIFVDDDGVADAEMGPWSHSATVPADEAGNLFYQFNLAEWFVNDYTVVATGECTTATTAFTDARVVTSATLNNGTSVSVAPSSSISASVTVQRDGSGENARWQSTGWRIATSAPSALGDVTCVNHANYTAGTSTESFSIPAPSASGTYNAYFIAYSDDGCTLQSGGAGAQSATYTMSGAVAVAVAKQSQTITFGALGDKTYGDASFTVLATASSNLTVSFSSLTPSTCAVSGNTVTLSAVGTCTVRASQGGDVTYNAATDVDQSFAIAKAAQASLTVTGPGSGTYGQKLTLSASGGSGTGATSFDATGTACTIPTTGADTGKLVITSGMGTCLITATKAADSNYNSTTSSPFTVSITPASAVIEVDEATLSQVYTGDALRAVVTTAPSVDGLAVVYTDAEGNEVDPINVGTYTLTATLTNDNYQAESVERPFSITPASAVIEVDEATLSQVYTGDALRAVVTTAPSVDGLAVVSTDAEGNEVDPINVGTYTLTATLTNDNYQAESVERPFSITQRSQTIVFTSAAPGSAKVGDSPYSPVATATSGLNVSYGASGACAFANGVVTVTEAGTCTVTANQAGNSNYSAAQQATQVFAVKPAPMTITGFFSPVDMPSSGKVNSVNAGSTVALKFTVSNGQPVTTTSSIKSIQVAQASLNNQNWVVEPVSTDALATGGTSLRYDSASGHFVYNWSTKGLTKGKTYAVTVETTDGSKITAYFLMK